MSAGSNSYGYDANGNMTTRNGSTISYTSYNLPTSIPSGANSSTLAYGAWRNTVKQVAVNAGTTETTIYVAGLLEKVTKGTTTEYRHRIDATPGTVAIYVRKSSGSNATYYLHRDHLGSPEMITNAAGNSVVKLSFSAYGERRDVDWDGPITNSHLTSASNVTRHGFTDHLHLDSVKLVRMGGRVYDPVIGRFLSRDPYIDGVASSQGANGYAYVWNNPLTRWDPTGFSRIPPSAPILPIDPVTGLEQVIVTASRLRDDDWNSFMVGIVMNFAITTTSRPTGPTGGGGQSGGDGAKQREEKQKNCIEDCRNDYEGAMQATAGAIGGAVGGGALALQTGNIPGFWPAVGVGAAVGAVTGAASGYMTQAVRSGGAGGGAAAALGATAAAPVGYTATAFAQGGSATFGGAMVGAASGAAGGLVPGSGGAAASAGISAMAARQFSLFARGAAGIAGAFTAAATYHALDVVRTIHCESECSAH